MRSDFRHKGSNSTLVRRIAPIVAVVLTGTTALIGSSPADAATPPVTIPAVQSWKAGGTTFTWTKSSRLVVDGAAGSLTDDAAVVAEDLAARTGTKPPVVTGTTADVRAGDVFLALGATDPKLGSEGYQLTANSSLTVRARTADGVFGGTRTLLQLLTSSRGVPGGTITDWPRYPVRSLMLHNAPRKAGMAWYRNQLRDLSYLKFNEVMVFVESNDLAQQVREFAERYHIRVLPHINMPSHMWSLEKHPEFQLTDRDGRAYQHALDLANPKARAWALDTISDHIGAYSGPSWHLGADEYPGYEVPLDRFPKLTSYAREKYGPNANARDVVKGFINDADQLVRRHGKSLRIWNDTVFTTKVVQLRPEITVEHWSTKNKPRTPRQLADDGHSVVNANRDFLFYAAGRNPDGTPRPKTDPRKLYEHFQVGDFHGGAKLPASDPKLAGIRLSQWNSSTQPDSDASIEAGLFATTRVVGQLGWGTPKPVPTWSAFEPRVKKLGRAPGFVPTKE